MGNLMATKKKVNLTGASIKDQYLEAEKKMKNNTSASAPAPTSQVTSPAPTSDYQGSIQDKYYKNMYDTLDKERENALKNQYIRAEKLQKYVPKVMQASGYGGSGLSESALISAYNDNNTQINSIESDFASKKNEVLKQYADYQDQQYEKQMNLYKEIMDGISSGVMPNESTLSGLSDEYRNIAQSYIDAYGKESAKTTLQEMLDTFYDTTIEDKDKPDSQSILDYVDGNETVKAILEDPANVRLKNYVEQLKADVAKAEALSKQQEDVPDADGGGKGTIEIKNLTAESFGNDKNKLGPYIMNKIIEDLNNKNIKDGTYINVNVKGAPTDYYYVKDGKLIHTDGSRVTYDNYWGWEKYITNNYNGSYANRRH